MLKKERLLRKYVLQVPYKCTLSSCAYCIRIINASLWFDGVFAHHSHMSAAYGYFIRDSAPIYQDLIPAVLIVIFVSFNFFYTNSMSERSDMLTATVAHNSDTQRGME